MKPVITLLTDFGIDDSYAAAVKGVILSINPEAVLVDVTHSVRPQDIPEAAFILINAYPCFPQGTVHLAVVDPGVGTERAAVLLETARGYFVAPDNGILSYVLEDLAPAPPAEADQVRFPQLYRREVPPEVRAYSLTNPAFHRHPVSATFHGRDIFAPAAAHLSRGVPPDGFGERLSHLAVFPIPHPQRIAEGLVGHVVHVDHFGNLITDVRNSDLLSRDVIVEVKGRRIEGIVPSYAHGEGPVAVIGSGGRLEIAVKNGSAADYLHMGLGDGFMIRSAG